MQLLLDKGADINYTDAFGRRAIHYASFKTLPQVRLLLDAGADVTAKTKIGQSPLHIAVASNHLDVVELILSKTKHLINEPDIDGWTPLMKPIYWAAGEGNESICSMLLDNEDECGLFLKPADYQAAFSQAIEKGSLGIVKMLWDRREVILNGKNQYDYTPLQSAANKGHTEIVKFLIDQGALIEDHEQGDQALIHAASEGHFEFMKLLILEGKNEDTPLITAAGKGHEKVIKVLLANGADRDLTNKFGDTALDIAEENGKEEVIALLEG
ncbi:ankyrin [Hyaloscypha bicolor E]|uniref:Ankyrin n=1 Tax=Hyaloscypha bicolor E TaxID=1095630 RepID=A0A2J6SG97_9HELO|nr:ankyrin [Hyaloscypha bicolor E]PMD49787.1 ankyrin [Hyaloscypha bicolor E]